MRRSPRGGLWALGLLLLALPGLAWGQQKAELLDPDEGAEVQQEAEAGEGMEEELEEDPRLAELEERVEELTRRLEEAEKSRARSGPALTFGGSVDLGFFVPGGNNGAGLVEDVGNRAFPEYAGRYGWVFLGDLLATPVNSRGEAADLGDLPGVERQDLIHARGAPGFLVNELNVRASVGMSERLLLSTSVNFTPRTGSEFSLGDVLDVDIVQLEWQPFSDGRTSVFVGKFDSVVGIEYRERKAHQRFGITPSLVHRYTAGTPIGLKVRTRLLEEHLVVAAALTNGSSSTEQFHFSSETDTNVGKTVSGRVSGRFSAAGEWEVGLSGEYGPQPRARDNSGMMYLWGVDAQFRGSDLTVKAQFLSGSAPGSEVDRAYALNLRRSGYLEANYLITPVFGALVRAELRDAFVSLTDERAYLTRGWRATVGGRATLSEHVVIKAEYLLNGEYGGIPHIPNDLFTSSLLITY
jgi:hypothetical protein